MQSAAPIRHIVKRNGNIVRYDRERITSAIFKATASTGQPDRALAEAMAELVEQMLVASYADDPMPSVEDIQDSVERVLIENRHAKLAQNYITYRRERAMLRATRACTFEVTDNIPYKKIYEVLLWNLAHRCESVESLNALLKEGGFPELVRAAERRFDEELGLAVQGMQARAEKLRLVIVAGPSSSGKTTTTARIAEQLRAAGMRLKTLNVDNYFFDLVQHPRDEFGDYDYETPQSLDLPLINEHLGKLVAGRSVKTPIYNFKTGQRTLDAADLHLDDNEILLLDSLHGLYNEMTQAILPSRKYRLYVETLGQLRATDGTFMRWADNRLLRRMLRDRDHRNLQPLDTITHWHYVRRSELKSIIPFIGEADFILNTALPYELPLLRNKLWSYLPDAVKNFRADPRRQDAYVRARRVHDLLAPIEPVANDAFVPPESLFREFIGGSRYGP